MAFTPCFRAQAPLETYTIENRLITVCRADLVPEPPLPSYVKMIELYPFLQHLAGQGYQAVGYYAVKESEWVRVVPALAQSVGLKAIIGLSKTKVLPAYAQEIASDLYLLTPNIYSVNWSRTKKHVESQGGYMVPMGLECEEVIAAFTRFLSSSPLPVCDNLVVPVGSGVCLAGILRHVQGRCQIHGVCTRPIASVQKVVNKYVDSPLRSLLHLYPRPDIKEWQAPFPMHRFWEAGAYQWLLDNGAQLQGEICFLNLGS